MVQLEVPPDPGRIDQLHGEIEESLDSLRAGGPPGPTLDMVAAKLDELISIAKALEAAGQPLSPEKKVALWHLGAHVTLKILERIVSATHFCQRTARQGNVIEKTEYQWRNPLRLARHFVRSGRRAESSKKTLPLLSMSATPTYRTWKQTGRNRLFDSCATSLPR